MSAIVRTSGTGYLTGNPLCKSAQVMPPTMNSLSAASEPLGMSRLILEGTERALATMWDVFLQLLIRSLVRSDIL